MATTEAVEPETERPRASQAGMAVRIVWVRLRFVAVLVVAFVVVGKWDTLRNYWSTFTRSIGGAESASQAVSNDTEYFCPMDPGVVSDWPGKCSICNMVLVRRKRGEAVALPGGVIARMQFSPYRLQLAGIQTSAAVYQPLAREAASTGHVAIDESQCHRLLSPCAGVVIEVAKAEPGSAVEADEPLLTIAPQAVDDAGEAQAATIGAPAAGRLIALKVKPGDHVTVGEVLGEVGDPAKLNVTVEVFEPDLPFLKEGQAAEVSSEALAGREPFSGRVRSIRPAGEAEPRAFAVDVALDDPLRDLLPGMGVIVKFKTAVAAIEPFRSQPSDPPPLKKGERRALYVCAEHADVVAERAGKCPKDGNALERRPLTDNQRLGWWCPMHPHVIADQPGATCRECGGMALVPRTITYSPSGQVLAVPASAVVDTGTMTVVYVDHGSGMFDGVEVVLGPRCGAWYPVVKGLEAGQRVATTGAFLIDAESRLNPSVAASYFGASQSRKSDDAASDSPSGATAGSPTASALAGFSAEDQALAARQRNCPVTGKPLGSMGKPVRLVVEGKTVFLCCDGCEEKFRKNAQKLLPQMAK